MSINSKMILLPLAEKYENRNFSDPISICDEDFENVFKMSSSQAALATALTKDTLVKIVTELTTRSADAGIPLSSAQKNSLLFRQHQTKVYELKKDMSRFLILLNCKNQSFIKNELMTVYQKLLAQTNEYLVLEMKKIKWLEVYHKKIYKRAIDQAKADVMKYLIRKYNLGTLDRIPENLFQDGGIEVKIWDPLTFYFKYLWDIPSAKVIGQFNPENNEIDLVLWAKTSEWEIYRTLIHEYLHAVSYQEKGRIGLNEKGWNLELNEAVTERVTRQILEDRVVQNQELFKVQVTVQHADDSYGLYIQRSMQIDAKIPIEHFVDAMLNQKGLENLKKVFEEREGEDAYQRFSLFVKNGQWPPKENSSQGILVPFKPR